MSLLGPSASRLKEIDENMKNAQDMASAEILVERARIVRAIRAFFDERGFVEVETAVRIPAPAPEEHIDCPPCRDGGYLRASPELQMKKLLAAGMDRIYQIGPCFREGERGARHNPEFTMIEWYRKNATYLDIASDLEALLGTLGLGQSASSEGACPLNSHAHPGICSTARGVCPQRLTVRETYLKYAGWDPWTGWDQDRFDFDMATKIEPALKALGGGVFLMDYPPQAASLAKLSKIDDFRSSSEKPSGGLSPAMPRGLSPCERGLSPLAYAERWEFYWDGMELANCFTELCDEREQRLRFAAAKANRQALGESDYPIDEAFLTSLPRIGSAAGVALGVDRLVMVLLGTHAIADVRAGV